MTSELAKAKLKVMAAVPYVQKGRTPGLNYSFAGEAAIIEKLHPAMREAGLTFAPSGCVMVSQESYTTKSGAAMNRVIVQATFTITHADSGQTETIQTLGEGADSGDKATSKAMTSALKYALRQAFLIETGDDPDHTPSEQQERGRPQQQHAQPRQPTPAQTAAAIPATGAELFTRLTDFDRKLAAAGKCRPGELVEHVVAAGVKAGYARDLSTWSGPAIEFGVNAAKQYKPAAAAKGQQSLPGTADARGLPD